MTHVSQLPGVAGGGLVDDHIPETGKDGTPQSWGEAGGAG